MVYIVAQICVRNRIFVYLVPQIESSATTRDSVWVFGIDLVTLATPHLDALLEGLTADAHIPLGVEFHDPHLLVRAVLELGMRRAIAITILHRHAVLEALNPRKVVLDIYCIATKILLRSASQAPDTPKHHHDKQHNNRYDNSPKHSQE